MNGPVSSIGLGTTDVSAPGAPILSNYLQVSNTAAKFDAQMPGADSDGSGLTGLKGFNYATLLGADPLGPTPTADDVIASGAAVVAITLSDGDAGTVKADIPTPVLVPGQAQTTYAYCND